MKGKREGAAGRVVHVKGGKQPAAKNLKPRDGVTNGDFTENREY